MENIRTTKSQESALCKVLKMAEAFDLSHGEGEYEIKRYIVKDHGFFISVSLEVGMVGDEGTMAQLVCRDRVLLFIGKHGAITYPITGRDGHQRTKAVKGSLLGACIAQRI